MGSRGPKRLPTKTLVARGSRKAKGRNDVEVPVGKLRCPAGLNKTAKRHWRDVVADLSLTTILCSHDRHLLKELCESYAKLEKWRILSENPVIKTSTKETKKVDGTIEKSGGNLIHNPYTSAFNKEREHYESLAAKFYMGPANRAGMGNIQSKEKDDKSRFFMKKKP